MPILDSEPDLYPDDLLDGPGEFPAEDRLWWAIYCLARREKQLMRLLRAMDIAFYGPLVSKRNRSPSGRTRTSHVPLFPGYIFLCGSEEQRQAAMTTNCISQCIEAPDPASLIEDLRQIRNLICAGQPVTMEAKLEAGQQVRVKSGPFANVEGTVLRRQNKTRLLVSVRYLQQGASVLLEDCDLELLD